VGRFRRRTGAMGREGDHERPIGLGAEGDAKAPAAADALDLAAAFSPAAGGSGQATKRTPSWPNIAGASGGTTQTAWMPWRCSPSATDQDSV